MGFWDFLQFFLFYGTPNTEGGDANNMYARLLGGGGWGRQMQREAFLPVEVLARANSDEGI